MKTRPGQVFSVPSLVTTQGGMIKPDPRHDLLVIFLGSHPNGVVIDPVEEMERIGWMPVKAVWRVTGAWEDPAGVQDHALYLADTPVEAVESAVRWATPLEGLALLAVSHAPLGRMTKDGELPDPGRPLFAWKAGPEVQPLYDAVAEFKTMVEHADPKGAMPW